MYRIVKLVFTLVLLSVAQATLSEEADSNTPNATDSSATDPRQLVTMPEQARELMRKDMLDHLAAVNEIIGYLAANDLENVSLVAETRLGRSSMGKHRGTGMGPGRFMPPDMRNMGWSMHVAATDFALVAKKGDLQESYKAFQKVTSSCVACHSSFRTR